MATVHLTNDNGAAAFGNQKNHLGGISTVAHGEHLVVVKQKTNWSNKEFVVTPSLADSKYFTGWSLGWEQYPSAQGGSNVYNDTNTLITNVRNTFTNKQWKSGSCALFTVSSRASGPYAIYNNYYHSDSYSSPEKNSEFGVSLVALKFDLKHLHFSKMTSHSAYIRCWGASIAFSRIDLPDASSGILINGGFYNGASQLRVKFFDELPTLAWNVAENADSFEYGNHVNNGRVVSQDTLLSDGEFCNYSPFKNKMSYYTSGNSSRVYTLQDNTATPQPSPTNYYHDFQITNADNLSLLSQNPGTIWIVAGFHMGNPFSDGGSGHNGIIQGGAATAYCERIELVLKCNSSAFNN